MASYGAQWNRQGGQTKGKERGASCRLDSQGNVRFSGAAPSYAQLQQGNGALPAAAAYNNMLQQNGSLHPGRRVAVNPLSAAPCFLAVGDCYRGRWHTYTIAIELMRMQDDSR